MWVNFFVDRIWDTLPADIASALLQLSEDELLDLPTSEIKVLPPTASAWRPPSSCKRTQTSWPESLRSFVHSIRSLPLPSDGMGRPYPLHVSLLHGLSPKKKHEARALYLLHSASGTYTTHITGVSRSPLTLGGFVQVEMLTSLIASLTQSTPVSHVIDIGAGKGYLITPWT